VTGHRRAVDADGREFSRFRHPDPREVARQIAEQPRLTAEEARALVRHLTRTYHAAPE
jgi:hypothetical protein